MAEMQPIVQRLTVFTERDCRIIVNALEHYVEEYAEQNELPRCALLIEKLS